MRYCYPRGLEKRLCKWDTYVPLVTKDLSSYVSNLQAEREEKFNQCYEIEYKPGNMYQYLTIGLLLSRCRKRQPVQGTYPGAMLMQMAVMSFP